MNFYLLTQIPLVVGLASLLLLSAAKPKTQETLSHLITVVALVLCAIMTARMILPGQEFFGGAIRVTITGKVLAYTGLGLALLATILAEDYLPKLHVFGNEFRMVVLAQALGLFHLPMAGDLPTLFIAFELVSIPSYVLAGFNHRDSRANEAGMKYLILGLFASCLFLLGLVFLYGATGEIHLANIQEKLTILVVSGDTSNLVMAKASLAFLLAALFFKSGIAPLHFWLPEIYTGTNLASLAFLSSPAKMASLGLLGMILWGPFASLHLAWKPFLLAGALACALFGNLQAISQTQLKRILAYSGVANAGFILLSLLLNTASAFLFYLVTYGLTTLGILASLMALSSRTADVDELQDLQGLGRKHPWLASGFTLLLFSLAGIPLTSGFAAKFGIISEAFKPGLILPTGFFPVQIALVLLSLISFYVYFKIVRALWLPLPEGGKNAEDVTREVSWNSRLILGLCVIGAIGFGLFMRLPGTPY